MTTLVQSAPVVIVPGISSTHPTNHPLLSGLMMVWYCCFMIRTSCPSCRSRVKENCRMISRGFFARACERTNDLRANAIHFGRSIFGFARFTRLIQGVFDGLGDVRGLSFALESDDENPRLLVVERRADRQHVEVGGAKRIDHVVRLILGDDERPDDVRLPARAHEKMKLRLEPRGGRDRSDVDRADVQVGARHGDGVHGTSFLALEAEHFRQLEPRRRRRGRRLDGGGLLGRRRRARRLPR
jgi:hypothetical protein